MKAEYDSIDKKQTKTATELAYAEVISYNKKNLERELQNERRQQNRQQVDFIFLPLVARMYKELYRV